MPRSIIVVGFELAARNEKEALTPLTMLHPPANYGEEAKKKWAADNRDKILSQVYEAKFNTTVEQVYAVNLTTKSMFKFPDEAADEDTAPVSASTGFYNWLAGSQGAQYPDYPPCDITTPAFYGFDIKSFLRAVGIDCVTSGMPVPLSLWYGNSHAYDPYEMVIEDDIRRAFPLESLCKHLNLTYHETGVGDCRADAKLAIELITRYHLAPLVLDPETKPAKKSKKA